MFSPSNENERRNLYEEKVHEVERSAFTPLVFSATGGTSKMTTTFLKRLVACMANKSGEAYSTTMEFFKGTPGLHLGLCSLKRLETPPPSYHRPNTLCMLSRSACQEVRDNTSNKNIFPSVFFQSTTNFPPLLCSIQAWRKR